MGYRVVKIGSALFVILIAFYLYQYHFGFAFDGKRHQRQAYNAGAKRSLEEYSKAQTAYFKAHKKFSPDLHKGRPYIDGKSSQLYFVTDQPELSKFCSSCTFSESEFKIAAYGKLSDHEGVWVIDQNGRLENLKISK